MRRYVLLLASSLLIPTPGVLAQAGAFRPATLTGDVVDQTGALVAGAAITVHRGARAFEYQVYSDAHGRFAATGLAAGEYDVIAASPGFAVAATRVALSPGEARRIRLTLLVGSLAEDVRVMATEVAGTPEQLRRLPGSVDIIGQETLQQSRVFTTHEALRKVPGLHVRDEEGLGLRPNIGIRGINPTRSTKVLLLEDGIPLAYAPYGDNASYYHPPIDRFSRIEVLKGGAQIAYGPQTIAGLVNYITPTPPDQPSASASLAAGTRDYLNAQASYGTTAGRTGVLVDVMRKQADGARDHTRSELNDVNAKIVRPVGARQTWTLRGNYYSEDSTLTYSGLREDEFRANPRSNPFKNDLFTADRYGTSATHVFAINRHAALTTNVYFASFTRHWWRQSSNSNQRPNDASDPACAGMANLDTTCGNEGRLRQYFTGGVEPRLRLSHRAFGVRSETDLGVRVHLERQHRRQENGDTPTARAGRLVEHNLRDNQAFSTFLQNRFLIGGLTITPGVRVEHITYERTNRLANAGAGASGTTDGAYVIPGIGVSHSPGDRLTIFGGLHRGFAPPRTEDIITNQGGVVDLDPELSWNYEAGVRTTLVPGLRLDVAAFKMDYENQVVPASLAGGVGATLTNGGSTLHQGTEAAVRVDSAAFRASAHNVYVRTAWTYVPTARFTGVRFSNVAGFGAVSVTGNRLPYAPEHLLTAGTGYTHPSGFDVFVEAVHTSRQFGDDLNTVVPTPDGQRGLLPAYTVWNLVVNHEIGRASLYLSVKNLFDDVFIVDRSRGILPGMPRLVHSGVRVRF
jgi:Fe(3+) dicitrate transport protein